MISHMIKFTLTSQTHRIHSVRIRIADAGVVKRVRGKAAVHSGMSRIELDQLDLTQVIPAQRLTSRMSNSRKRCKSIETYWLVHYLNKSLLWKPKILVFTQVIPAQRLTSRMSNSRKRCKSIETYWLVHYLNKSLLWKPKILVWFERNRSTQQCSIH